MATNIEQIFRDFVMNKIKEIEGETQENSVTDEPQSEPVIETREDGLKEEKVNKPSDKVSHTDLQDNHGKEDSSTKHRKSKKHKKHKSKKKRKKRKEGKDSSSDSESDKETQESGKKKKRKKKKKSKDAEKAKRSGSRSKSSSASGSESESESKPSSETTKSSSTGKKSKSELKDSSSVGKPQELPDIIPKIENSVHKSTENERPKEKKRRSKSKESSRGRRSRSRSPKRKSERRSRSPKRQRRSKSTSRSRNSSKKRSHQQKERSRSRSKRCSRSRSHSVRRGKRSRSRSRSRRTRSRSVVISRRNRRSTSKSRSRSPRRRRRSRSKSQSRTKRSKSRSVSKSRSEVKVETELVQNNTEPEVEKSKSSDVQNTTENGSPTVAVTSDTKLSETPSSVSNFGFNAGSWRPVPFLAETSETKSSQKCITPEVPLEVTNVSEEPSTFSTATPIDLECAVSPEKIETDANPTLTSVEHNSTSPPKSPSQKTSSRSKAAARSRSKSPSKKRKSRSRSPSERKSHKNRTRSKRSKSRSPKKKRSRSRSQGRRRKSRTPDRSRRSKSRKKSRSRSRRRSRSGSRWRRGFGSRPLNQRDRWKREPSRSPVLILRKKRSTSRTRRSTSKTPPRLTELDKEQLLEIAKANAAAMCAKAGVPIPESLRPKSILQLPLPNPNSTSLSLQLPVMSNMAMNAAMASMTAATMTAALSSMGALASLPQMAPLPTIVNKPPSSAAPNLASIEEAKKKVAKQANSFSIKELTERCKKIAESKEEMAIAKPHVSDDEEDEKLVGASLKENKGIAFSLGNTSLKPAVRTEAVFAKEFPVSSGSQHRKKEADGAYGEWVPVEKKTEKPSTSDSSGTEETSKENDSVFPEAPSQPVDITLAVSERAVAQKRLAENPFDINAMCMLNRAQEQYFAAIGQLLA
ncbi:uncharacterized protein sonb [Garra rufa]|uniref:uncharacterized protein sonb n=1 Tax=Garra rufa TaxID=137080 RepID=UPI003CCE5A56